MAVQTNFPLHVLSRASLSKGAQRNFDSLMHLFDKTGVSPTVNFRSELELALHTTQLETLYYKTKVDQVNEKIEKISKPKWEAKLCLRDTLQNIYDIKVKEQEKELSLQSLKIQQEARQKLNNLREAQAEAN